MTKTYRSDNQPNKAAKAAARVKSMDINKEIRKLWHDLQQSGLEATTIKFEVVDGELREIQIFGKMESLKNEMV